MLLLTSSSDLIAVTPAQAASIEAHASWVDNVTGTITPGRTNTAANSGTSRFTVVAGPSSGQRNVKFLSIKNDHASASSAIDVEHYDGTTYESLWKGTLAAGDSVTLNGNGNWTIRDSKGVAKVNTIPGRFIGVKIYAATSGSPLTTGPQTNLLRVRCFAAGGGGGNATGNATQTAVGGGAGSGGYVEKWFTVTPNTQYSFTVGAGSAAGTNGNDTTFTVGATVITAKGGTVGASFAQTDANVYAVPGGAGGTVSTNGDINGAGSPGTPGLRTPGTAAIAANTFTSGAGGSAMMGAGGGQARGTAGNGNAGRLLGGGAGGGLSNSAAANNGGSGNAGAVIVEEYT